LDDARTQRCAGGSPVGIIVNYDDLDIVSAECRQQLA
jgi:hypothetical protein